MKTKFTRLVLTSFVIVALATLIQSCTEGNGKSNVIPKSAEPIPVKIVSLEKTISAPSILASGQITTDDETIMSFKAAGVIEQIYVKAGDAIKKGQLLARLDPTEINTYVSQARLGLEKSQRDFERVKNLYADSVATLEQLQNAETGVAVAKEQFDAANFNRNHSSIYAQANGYVLKKLANAGQVVGIGDPVLQTNGAGRGLWILKVGVSDRQWASIALRDKAEVKVDAFRGKVFQASVVRKSETSDPQTGAFTVELELSSEGNKLASGMFGSVQISSGLKQTSWSVPYEAVLDASGDAGFVFITNDNRTAVRQAVTIESFDGKSIRISKGLEDAKALIVAGSAYLKDQSPINIVK